MVRSNPFQPRAAAAIAALVLASLALGGCSRNTDAAEQLAAANAAAGRAEKAASRAETALQRIEKIGQPQVVEVDPNLSDDNAEPGVSDLPEPDGQNQISDQPAPPPPNIRG